jgi:hypothetical protein
MAQAVSRRPLNAEARIRTQVSPCGICDERIGTGAVFNYAFQKAVVLM